MSIFNRLFHFHRGTEDYFSEIVSFLLTIRPVIFSTWFSRIYDDFSENFTRYTVQTQISLGLGRPDFIIEVFYGSESEIFFMESKLGSFEGPNQLARYAQALVDEYPNALRHRLIFVTRDYEPKESISRQPVFSNIRFKQIRWYSFFVVLQSYLIDHQDDTLVSEVSQFMEEHDMSEIDQFSLEQMVALTNLESLLAVMKQTLDIEFQTKFKKLAGKLSISDLQEVGRFTVHKLFEFQKGGWGYYGIGYYFNKTAVSEYPTVRLHIGIMEKNDPQTKILTSAMKEWGLRPGWRLTESHDTYFSVAYLKSVMDFLPMESPVQQIKIFLSECLAELSDLKSNYPDIPW
jgi:hypothetical protein